MLQRKQTFSRCERAQSGLGFLFVFSLSVASLLPPLSFTRLVYEELAELFIQRGSLMLKGKGFE